MYTKELYHYGVLGMKWGVRKSRIAGIGGAMRNSARKGREASVGVRRKRALSPKASAKYTYSQRHLLSDAELQKRINRLNMDRQLRDLADQGVNAYGPYSSPTIRSGRDALRRGLAIYGARRVATSWMPGLAPYIKAKK